MASVLLVSKEGDGCALALKLAQEGNIVKYWIEDEKAKHSLQGFKNPSPIKDPKTMIEQYDLILSDMVGLGSLLDDFKEKGKLVLGGGSFNDKLELDRDYGIKVASSLLKIDVPESETFDDVEDAISYVKAAKVPLVIKPMGNRASQLSLVSEEEKNRTLLSYLESIGQQLMPCVIQERIDGFEISTEGWFDGKEFVPIYNHTFEKKRFMEGDKGCNTGCIGNVVFLTESDKLTQTAIEPLAPLFKEVGYVGPVDTNCIINEEGAFFIEFTARFGYNAIEALMELVKGTIFDFLYKIASRSKSKINWRMNEFSIAVRLSLPPWPTKDESVKNLKGIQVLDIPESAQNHIWLADVLSNNGIPVMAGVDGVIGCVTAYGTSLREAKRRVYRTIDNVVIHKDIQYRKDIGEDVERQIKLLTEWGWLNGSTIEHS